LRSNIMDAISTDIIVDTITTKKNREKLPKKKTITEDVEFNWSKYMNANGRISSKRTTLHKYSKIDSMNEKNTTKESIMRDSTPYREKHSTEAELII
jgi:hypothetical protein